MAAAPNALSRGTFGPGQGHDATTWLETGRPTKNPAGTRDPSPEPRSGCDPEEGEGRIKPQDYSTRTKYRPPAAWYQRLNWLGVLLTSLGLAPRDAVTLEVRGRSSGKARRIPILRTRLHGSDYLVALAGESQWVRNVRAAHGHAVIRRRRRWQVRLQELGPSDRGDVIAAYLRAGGRRSGAQANAEQARYYFGLDPQATPADIAAIVDYYPVFRIHYDS